MVVFLYFREEINYSCPNGLLDDVTNKDNFNAIQNGSGKGSANKNSMNLLHVARNKLSLLTYMLMPNNLEILI